MLKVKKSVNIFFFERNAKYINYYTFSGIPLTPRLQKVIFLVPQPKMFCLNVESPLRGKMLRGHFNESEERA